jgi:hypothetical protein
MTVNTDFRDLFYEFNTADVRYIVVGAYAVTFHAKPRFTKDLDIWIDTHPDNTRSSAASSRPHFYAAKSSRRSNDRIVKVERRAPLGAAWRFVEVLSDSEDSRTLNTSLIERLNLTIRRSSNWYAAITTSSGRIRR